jgi:hypothetical protein
MLAVALACAYDRPGTVLVGTVDRVALREDDAWMVSVVLRRPLSPEVVDKTPTLFAALCEGDACDQTVPISGTRDRSCP